MIGVSQISSLARLMDQGFVADTDEALQPFLRDIAHSTGDGWVLGRRLLSQRERLSSDNELVMAVLALDPSLRAPWLRVLAARCKEAGQMANDSLLVDLVSGLGESSEWVEAQLASASLDAMPTATVERELLGVSAEQSAATPALVRVIAAAYALQNARLPSLPVLPPVDKNGLRAHENWSSGRLLALPDTQAAGDYLLCGAGECWTEFQSMSWALANPWILLLAMTAYAQDTWTAEARGGLLMEVPAAAGGSQGAYHPGAVDIVVVGPEGDETRCGTLGELLLRVLRHLGVYCFPHQPTHEELDALLAPRVGVLLERRVWQFRDGASGTNGQYQIHPEFADECYRIAGSKVFNRTGKHLWQAIRMEAEQWRSELRTTRREGEKS
jgi:hypothetical protein